MIGIIAGNLGATPQLQILKFTRAANELLQLFCRLRCAGVLRSQASARLRLLFGQHHPKPRFGGSDRRAALGVPAAGSVTSAPASASASASVSAYQWLPIPASVVPSQSLSVPSQTSVALGFTALSSSSQP